MQPFPPLLFGGVSSLGPSAAPSTGQFFAYDGTRWQGRAILSTDIPALAYDATGTAAGLLDAHVAAADPHTQYVLADGSRAIGFLSVGGAGNPGTVRLWDQGAGDYRNVFTMGDSALVVGNVSDVSAAGVSITAGEFIGAGTNLTSLNGSNIATGTVADARIASTIARLASPTFTTPNIGAATAATVNGNAITAGTGTLTLSTFTLTAAGNASVSGTNTGDQTAITGNAGTATKLETARTINGVSFDGTANITVTAAGSTLSDTVTVDKGGTGRTTSTTAYGLIAAGTTATGAHQTLPVGLLTQVLVGGGAGALPVWTTATGGGSPVRATSPVLVTPLLGTPASGVLTNCTGTASGLTAGAATVLATARAINGVSFNGSADITVTAAPTTHASTHALGAADPVTTEAVHGTRSAATGTSGTVSVDLNANRVYSLTPTANVTAWTVTNDANGRRWQLLIVGGTGFTVAWPYATVYWSGGAAPTNPTASGRRLLVAFERLSAGVAVGFSVECY